MPVLKLLPVILMFLTSIANAHATEQIKDEDTIMRNHKAPCKEGNAKACYKLGVYFLDSKQGNVSPVRAEYYLNRACRDDYEKSCKLLKELKKTKSYHLARFEQYKQECESGQMLDCINLGQMYEHGRCVTQDYVTAIEHYADACKNGEMTGCYHIARMYEYGRGFSQSYDKAVDFYERTCASSVRWGCMEAARIHLYGFSEQSEIYEAKRLFELACKYGSLDACSIRKKLDHLPRDSQKEMEYYKSIPVTTPAQRAKPQTECGTP